MQENIRHGLSDGDKRRLIELVMAVGMVLALTSAFTSLYFRFYFSYGGWTDLVFRATVVLFIVSGLRAYVALLKGRLGGAYKVFVGIMLASFTFLLADILEELLINPILSLLFTDSPSWAIVLPAWIGFNLFFFWWVIGQMYKALTK